MSITFRQFNQHDDNYLKVIELYKDAFPGAQAIPTSLLSYKFRKGKAGFHSLYQANKWIGLIYCTYFNDIVFIQFLAISDELRSQGYGSKVMESIRQSHLEKRIVLNIEEIDERSGNYEQRLKRKAFYEKNGFRSTGYIVKEPRERQEMLIRGGTINKEEIQAMYKNLFGAFLGFIIRPKIIKIAS